MKRFRIGAMLIATASVEHFVPAGQAQSVASTGFSSSNAVSPFPITAVEPSL
jgi:hypothetical protein